MERHSRPIGFKNGVGFFVRTSGTGRRTHCLWAAIQWPRCPEGVDFLTHPPCSRLATCSRPTRWGDGRQWLTASFYRYTVLTDPASLVLRFPFLLLARPSNLILDVAVLDSPLLQKINACVQASKPTAVPAEKTCHLVYFVIGIRLRLWCRDDIRAPSPSLPRRPALLVAVARPERRFVRKRCLGRRCLRQTRRSAEAFDWPLPRSRPFQYARRTTRLADASGLLLAEVSCCRRCDSFAGTGHFVFLRACLSALVWGINQDCGASRLLGLRLSCVRSEQMVHIWGRVCIRHQAMVRSPRLRRTTAHWILSWSKARGIKEDQPI